MSIAAQRSRDDHDHERRRAAIRRRLRGAVEQMIAGGDSYANVGIERLAGAAGISRATFYIYFDGKGDLLHAWLDETLAELRAGARVLLDLDGDATPTDICRALHQILAGYRTHATVMVAVYDEATRDGALRAGVDGAIDAGISALTAWIERGQADGFVDRELLPWETASWLVWLLERGLNHVVPDADDARLRALAETLAQMAWRTLYCD
jgi:AcrR family transcriptional regulator